MTITSNDTINKDVKYNVVAHDVLMKLPSISTKNVSVVADSSVSIKHLASMRCLALTSVLTNKRAAESITSFFNTVYTPETKDITKSALPAKKVAKGSGKG